jgi:hypothetical protein
MKLPASDRRDGAQIQSLDSHMGVGVRLVESHEKLELNCAELRFGNPQTLELSKGKNAKDKTSERQNVKTSKYEHESTPGATGFENAVSFACIGCGELLCHSKGHGPRIGKRT